MSSSLLSDLMLAINQLIAIQGHPPLYTHQVRILEYLITGQNSINQLPCGSGKTYPSIVLPQLLDILRDNYHHDHIPEETRVLIIVPLVNIFYSLEQELIKLNIPYQFMMAGTGSEVNRQAKVIVISPEKLLDKLTLSSIKSLEWSAISLDEPHLALEWGLSKRKNRKPFREAFQKLSRLNELCVPFELHSATIKESEELYKLLGRKHSVWKKQIQVPERQNLTYYLISGPAAPTNILQIQLVRDIILGDEQDLLLIYVQTIEDGTNIFFDIYQFSVDNGHGLIGFPTRKCITEKTFAFLHSNLTEESKKKIISDAQSMKLKVLIATSSAGAGVHLPITKFIGWGLDREPSGIVQASGRTARGSGEGLVLWVHNSSLHGRRVPGKSAVRDMLKGNCLRTCINGWFSDDCEVTEGAQVQPPAPGEKQSPIQEGVQRQGQPPAHNCCSVCMQKCLNRSLERSCGPCKENLDKIKFECKHLEKSTSTVKVLSTFLKGINIAGRVSRETPSYNEDSLAKMILANLSESENVNETIDYLEIFALGHEVSNEIGEFLKTELSLLSDLNSSKHADVLPVELPSETSDSCTSESDKTGSEEYFDEDDSDDDN